MRIAEICHHISCDVVGRFRSFPTLYSPRPTWVQYIPSWTHSSIPTTSWIVISETVNNGVPYRRKSADKERLAEWNPDVFDNQKATMEFFEIEVFDRSNAFRMFAKAIEKRFSRCINVCATSSSGSCMHSFPNVDWGRELFISVSIRQFSVSRKFSRVIKHIDPCALKYRQFSKRVYLAGQ